MNAVPPSPDPDRRPAGSAAGREPGAAVPPLTIGRLGDVRPGCLLVAMPLLTDPNFAGTVVYVVDHSSTGTVGVVLNRPSEVRIADVLPGWADLAVPPGMFHVGGPCESETALCLAAGPGGGPGLQPVGDGVHLVDLDVDPGEVSGAVDGLRVFAGYAGWSPGQLGGELAEGAWACVPGLPADVLAGDEGMRAWHRVLARQSGPRAVLTTATPDPTQN
ncbi:putative transcriptional regulator [Klenkia marina]|uniref:Putative transcriptional regulator n=1 Tax=Klenkia marina TaxID=1960309 RepID=A0A1G4YZY0_9ACTN|nr:YqgE/AlgH family protein [Klenkia marina]SCX59020.1 putative transcriptional regulator [Klenkia marina]